jgi:ABC-type nitrate/sulfonate/bicarbonate transport system substrate-binding protein
MNAYRIDSPTVLCLSGGRTSAYMLRQVLDANGGLPDCARVVFCNTGKEHHATLDFVRDMGDNWGVAVTWLEYTSDGEGFRVVSHETACRDGGPYEALIRARRYLPNSVVIKEFLHSGESAACRVQAKTL